jgi:hypothetical protein
MPLTIDLPMLAGSREAANSMAAALGHDLSGETVVVNCRDLFSASPSFIDQLVKRLLLEKHAATLIFLGADGDVEKEARDSATLRNVAEQLQFFPAGVEIDA